LQVAETVKSDLIVVGRSAKALHRFAGSLGRRLIGKSQAPLSQSSPERDDTRTPAEWKQDTTPRATAHPHLATSGEDLDRGCAPARR
jgi:hypothetical protein